MNTSIAESLARYDVAHHTPDTDAQPARWTERHGSQIRAILYWRGYCWVWRDFDHEADAWEWLRDQMAAWTR